MTPKKTRINVFLDPDLAAELVKKGEELGMSKTGITSLAVHFGFQAIKLATNPELKEYFEKQIEKDDKKNVSAS